MSPLAEHLPAADPGLADIDAHQGVRIDGVGILLQDGQIGKLARFEGSELVAQADLAGGVAGHCAQGVARLSARGPQLSGAEPSLRACPGK